MAQEQKTAYFVFVQACWAQHKRQYPDKEIRQEIEEFNVQCSTWWYNLSEEERERFQQMADSHNSLVHNTAYIKSAFAGREPKTSTKPNPPPPPPPASRKRKRPGDSDGELDAAIAASAADRVKELERENKVRESDTSISDILTLVWV